MATFGETMRGGMGRLTPGQIIAAAAALVAGLVLGWYGFKTAFGDGSSVTAPVATVRVQPTTVQQTATTSGTINAPANSKLTFPVAGRLANLNVKQGQTVQKGDILATLDPTQLQIALAQAQSNQKAAQAKLDALLAGATPDVVAAARAAVAQAQSAALTAQNQLSTAQAGKVSAQNNVGTASNAVATATNSVTTAQASVAQAQAALDTDQNNLQALQNGPIQQDIAVSQAGVDTARSNLDTAQQNYDRLVNHTDLATRTETSALASATSAYQGALAALANALPQPANPLDITNAQLAVSKDQQELQLAQQNATAAAASLTLAQQTASVGNAPTFSCGGLTNGALSCGVDAAPLTASQTSANNNAITSAQSQVSSTTGAFVTAQSTLATDLNNLQKLLTPYSSQDYGGLKASVDSAKQLLDIAQKNYDNYLKLPDLAIRPETTALNTARTGYESAVAQYNLKVAPAKPTDIANAQAAIQKDQANLQSAHAAEANAEVAVSTAALSASSAAATAATSDTAIGAAAGGVDSAQQSVTSSQAKLHQTVAPPLETDIIQATETVNQAKDAVDTAQVNLDNATLRAPFSGVIASATGNPGDQISGANVIVQLVDTSNVELDAQVDETTYGQTKVGMPVRVNLDSLPGQTLTGFITTIVPSGTTTQGVVLFPVVITLANPALLPPVGASASSITITIQAKSNVLAVAGRYIYRDASGAQVVDVIKNGKRVPTKVETGLVSTATTEISSGLSAGDQVALPLKSKSGGSTFGQGGVPGLPGGGGGGGAVVRGGGG